MDISCHARSFKQGLIVFISSVPILKRNAVELCMYIVPLPAMVSYLPPSCRGQNQYQNQNSSLYVLQCSLVPAIDKICISIQKAKTKQNFSVSVYLFIHLFIHQPYYSRNNSTRQKHTISHSDPQALNPSTSPSRQS